MMNNFFRARLARHDRPKASAGRFGARRLAWRKCSRPFLLALPFEPATCNSRRASSWWGDREAPGTSVNNVGRARLPLRFMIALILLKNNFDLSAQKLVERFAGSV